MNVNLLFSIFTKTYAEHTALLGWFFRIKIPLTDIRFLIIQCVSMWSCYLKTKEQWKVSDGLGTFLFRNWGGKSYFKLPAILFYSVRMEWKAIAEQIFPLKKHYLSVLREKQSQWKGKKKITSQIHKCFYTVNRLSRAVGLPLWLAVAHSLQGRWNSEAGRGVQCVVSKFCMYFRAWWLEERDGRRRRHWDRKVWEAASGKGRAWLH